MIQFSFQWLKKMTENAARGYYEDIDTNYAILKSMTSVLTVMDFGDIGMLTDVLNAFVIPSDGNTGYVLLDTWHDSLGNLTDCAQREYRMGDTVIKVQEEVALEGTQLITKRLRTIWNMTAGRCAEKSQGYIEQAASGIAFFEGGCGCSAEW